MIVIFLIAAILLVAAIIIIILFLTGVLSMGNEAVVAVSPTMPPVVYPPTIAPLPPITAVQNSSYACTFHIRRQANAAYDVKSSDIYISAFRMVQSALTTMTTQSSLRAYNAVAVLNDLRNSGDDVLVSFRLTLQLRAPLDERSVQSLLRTQYTRIETELGGNAVIDPNSITVTRSFM